MNRWGFKDLGVGVGLRTVHFGRILAEHPRIDWFEILSENFMDTGGRPLYVLDRVCERYPVAPAVSQDTYQRCGREEQRREIDDVEPRKLFGIDLITHDARSDR